MISVAVLLQLKLVISHDLGLVRRQPRLDRMGMEGKVIRSNESSSVPKSNDVSAQG